MGAAHRLNLGCGNDVRDGWLNVDFDDDAPADVHEDISLTPWEFAERDDYRIILLDNVLEHVEPGKRTQLLEECRRHIHPNGRLIVHLPVPEVGVGWDVTHYGVPAWWFLEHPNWRRDWDVLNYHASRVELGRLLPEGGARTLARKTGLRTIDEVRIEAMPR